MNILPDEICTITGKTFAHEAAAVSYNKSLPVKGGFVTEF